MEPQLVPDIMFYFSPHISSFFQNISCPHSTDHSQTSLVYFWLERHIAYIYIEVPLILYVTGHHF